MSEANEIRSELGRPFDPHLVHWRIGSTNAKKLACKPWEATKGMPLCYIDARDVMDRLDAVVGSHRWQDSYVETQGGRVICKLSVCFGSDEFEWVTKSDGAGDTGTEGEKGAISDAFKRAAVKFGIGRYLYGIKSGWIDLDNGRIPQSWLATTAPKLLPSVGSYFESKVAKTKSWNALKDAAAENDALKAREAWDEISSDQQQELWRELSSGQRSTLKGLLAEETK